MVPSPGRVEDRPAVDPDAPLGLDNQRTKWVADAEEPGTGRGAVEDQVQSVPRAFVARLDPLVLGQFHVARTGREPTSGPAELVSSRFRSACRVTERWRRTARGSSMAWPERWVPIDRPSEVSAFADELRAELSPGHCLFGLPLRAIGRRWDNIHAVFVLEDGSARVAEVILPWKRRPMEPPMPMTILFADFEEWARHIEYADWLAQLRPDPGVVPRLRKGDRVLMVKHSDWKADCRSTIIREGRPCIVGDGSTRVEYLIRFDEPQTDLTDKAAGLHIEYEGTTVLEEYLHPLG